MINQRKVDETSTHEDFDLLHRHYSRCTDWENVIREYPFGVGQVSLRVKDSKDFTAGSVWFVKPKAEGVREVFDSMTFNNAEGVMKSISKSMIVEEYEKYKVIPRKT